MTMLQPYRSAVSDELTEAGIADDTPVQSKWSAEVHDAVAAAIRRYAVRELQRSNQPTDSLPATLSLTDDELDRIYVALGSPAKDSQPYATVAIIERTMPVAHHVVQRVLFDTGLHPTGYVERPLQNCTTTEMDNFTVELFYAFGADGQYDSYRNHC